MRSGLAVQRRSHAETEILHALADRFEDKAVFCADLELEMHRLGFHALIFKRALEQLAERGLISVSETKYIQRSGNCVVERQLSARKQRRHKARRGRAYRVL